ncbi:hypothetical protein [Bifidobacterium thermophilum]|uniref:Uncharacterized protein n=1 Tax=Bifidobacterium thermophilum TaxID=33905 RepID=A0A7X9RMR1_9BIFI|nr:hypothetical protein [Bifidobacterium thermophilum]NME61831.1 hypothetical protein [Bifidobacterium thermophilum]
MSYKGYNGAETISYPYKQFKTWAEAWAEATAYDPEPRTPEVYRKPFRDYNTADDLMDPDTVGAFPYPGGRMCRAHTPLQGKEPT